MRQELLLEFFTEEIPARFQKKAILDAKKVFSKILIDYGAEFSQIETFVSPRRIAIRVDHLSRNTKGLKEEKRGPKTSAPEEAVLGFLKSNGKERSDLTEKCGYYYLTLEMKALDITELMGEIIEKFIANMPWKKSMRWYLEKEKCLSAFWVRPLRSILCLYAGSVIETYIKSVGLTTCDYTFGHRFLSSEKIRIFDFEDYVGKLEKNYVILDFFKKRDYIDRELTQHAAAMGLCLRVDSELLDEVSGLVEYPFIHIGTIDEKFMSLPGIVLSTSMKVHQKYFTLTYPDSIIAPFFGTVLNVPGTEIMYKDLDRVLRARLSDAMFFYKEDTDVTLEAFAQRLASVVFHEKLGSMSQKVDRMMSIANSRDEHRTIALCKADLMTQMVGEFPELQGKMGEIYAIVQGEDPNVSRAIMEHYKPIGAGDSLPENRTGARVAFFDKLDTLVGFIGVGIYPTGSKDPFALRRAALCVVRLLCDFNEDLLENETLSWYIKTLISSYSDQGIALNQNTLESVEMFIIERLKVYMADKLGIDSGIVESVIASFDNPDFDYKLAIEKAQKLSELYKIPEFQTVRDAYKRVRGIYNSDSEPVDKTMDVSNLDFSNNNHMNQLKSDVLALLKSHNDNNDIDLLIKASKSALLACENVLINDSDENIKTRNLVLLKAFADFVEHNIGLV